MNKADALKEMGTLGIWILWVTGRSWYTPEPEQDTFTFHQTVQWWKAELSPGYWYYSARAPNVLHRAAQHVLLGVRWQMLAQG